MLLAHVDVSLSLSLSLSLFLSLPPLKSLNIASGEDYEKGNK